MARTPSNRPPKRRDLRQKYCVQVPLPQDIYARLKTGADYYQLSMSAYVRRLVTLDVMQYEANQDILRLPPLRTDPRTARYPQGEGYLERSPFDRTYGHPSDAQTPEPPSRRLRSPWDQDTFDE